MVSMDLTMFLILVAILPVPLVLTGSDMHFMGGSMMFKFIDTTKAPYKLKVTTLTTWVKGMGPCGKNCSTADIGRSTTRTRNDILGLHGDTYFGNWTLEPEYTGSHSYKTVTSDVIGKINGLVTEVNLPMQFEQELTEFILDIDPTTLNTGIGMHGSYWHWVDYGLVRNPIEYRLQINVRPEAREDTRKPNDGPMVIFQSVYRILLNKVTTINLLTWDPDGDFVKCAYAEFVEAGGLRSLNNTVVNYDCSVVIDAQESAGFLDGGWGAIPVKVMDYAVKTKGDELIGYTLSNIWLSDINVQFMIQTLKTIDFPEFVNPTIEGRHEFVVYVGSTLKIPLYAKPASTNEIYTFNMRSIPYRVFTFDRPKNDNERKEEKIKYTIVNWHPGKSDVGKHIISALVTDTQGTNGLDRIYSIIVKDLHLLPQKDIPNRGPYFPLFPDVNGIVCTMASTCSFPIYTNTNTPGGVISVVKYTTSNFQTTTIDSPKLTIKDGTKMFVSAVTVLPSKIGNHRICFEAKENQGNSSAIKCLTVEVGIPDSCLSNPCLHGICRNQNRSYVCICDEKHTGLNCEKEYDFCSTKPCLNNGRCIQIDHIPYVKCDCAGTGHIGWNCGTDIVDCKPGVCGPYGVCRDLYNKFECDCYNGYSGVDCKSIDNTCKGVTCKNGGICIGESGIGVCECPLGFSGPNCNGANMSPQVNSGTKDNPFIVPSLVNGAKIECPVKRTCILPVYTNGTADVYVGLHSRDMTASIQVMKPSSPIDSHSGKSLLKITPNIAGLHTICVHTGGIYPDTLCYRVDAKVVGHHPTNKKLIPKFVVPTPHDRSLINCIHGTPCRVVMTTDVNPFTNNCTLYSGSTSAIIFKALLSGRTCETDVLFNPPATGDKEVCLQAGSIFHLRGTTFQGERRCFSLKTTATDSCNPNPCHNGGACILQPGDTPPYQCLCPDTATGDYCQYSKECPNTSCQNGGVCALHGNGYKCKCPIGYGGHDCSPVRPTIDAQFTDPTLNNGATIVCEVGETCDIQVFMSGNSALLDVGPRDKDVDVDLLKHIGKPAAIHNEDLLRVTPLTVGILNVCIVTKSGTSVRGHSVCYHIKANQGHIAVGMDDFKSPTLPAGSTIPCEASKQCHLMMYSRPDGHKCQQVEDLGSAGLDLHIFPSKLEGGSCVNDVLFSSDVPTGTRRLCLGLGTSSLRCYKVDPNTAEPCKNQTCGHGACIVEGNSHSCVCDEKHRGPACEHDIDVPIIG